VAHFDAPQLVSLQTTFFDHIVFDTPQLGQFISRIPKLNEIDQININFEDNAAKAFLSSISSRIFDYGELEMKFSCRRLDRRFSSLTRVCTSSLPPFSTLENLYINEFEPAYSNRRVENMPWLELLRPFRAVKNLYLSEDFAPYIVPALQELVGERTTEVLPVLQKIFLGGRRRSGPVREGIRQFVATQQVTSHPVAVSRWFRQWDDDDENDDDDDDGGDGEYGVKFQVGVFQVGEAFGEDDEDEDEEDDW
jgi:hypothetical protein